MSERAWTTIEADHDDPAGGAAVQTVLAPVVRVLAAGNAAVDRSWSATLFDHAEPGMGRTWRGPPCETMCWDRPNSFFNRIVRTARTLATGQHRGHVRCSGWMWPLRRDRSPDERRSCQRSPICSFDTDRSVPRSRRTRTCAAATAAWTSMSFNGHLDARYSEATSSGASSVSRTCATMTGATLRPIRVGSTRSPANVRAIEARPGETGGIAN